MRNRDIRSDFRTSDRGDGDGDDRQEAYSFMYCVTV